MAKLLCQKCWDEMVESVSIEVGHPVDIAELLMGNRPNSECSVCKKQVNDGGRWL